MQQIRISLRTTDRVVELARLIRPVTGAPMHEITAAATGRQDLFAGELSDRVVESRVARLLDALSESHFAFWIALDGDPTSPDVIRNMLRTSRESLAEQQLLGHLESSDGTVLERLGLRAELLLGVRWRAKIILAMFTLALLILVIGTWSSHGGGY